MSNQINIIYIYLNCFGGITGDSFGEYAYFICYNDRLKVESMLTVLVTVLVTVRT